MMAMGIPANAKQLAARVKEGEGPALELKRSTGELKEGMQTLCAFLNGSAFPAEIAGTRAAPSRHQAGTKAAPSRDQVAVLESCRVERTLLELVKVVGRADRTKFRGGVVKPLIEMGLLELTIPDKPRSRMQRYRTTEAGLAALKKPEHES